MISTLQRLRRREVRQEASGTLLGPNGPPQSGPALSAAADLRPADGAKADLVLEEEVAERARIIDLRWLGAIYNLVKTESKKGEPSFPRRESFDGDNNMMENRFAIEISE